MLAAGTVAAISGGLALPVVIAAPQDGVLTVNAEGQVLALPTTAAGPISGPGVLILTGPRPLPDAVPPEALGSANSRH